MGEQACSGRVPPGQRRRGARASPVTRSEHTPADARCVAAWARAPMVPHLVSMSRDDRARSAPWGADDKYQQALDHRGVKVQRPMRYGLTRCRNLYPVPDAIRPWTHRTWGFPRDPAFKEKTVRLLEL